MSWQKYNPSWKAPRNGSGLSTDISGMSNWFSKRRRFRQKRAGYLAYFSQAPDFRQAPQTGAGRCVHCTAERETAFKAQLMASVLFMPFYLELRYNRDKLGIVEYEDLISKRESLFQRVFASSASFGSHLFLFINRSVVEMSNQCFM